LANWITAIAALIAAIATVAYFFATYYILLETKKSAAAAEKSAAAADKSADAARESVALVRQEIEQQAGLGAFIVSTTIDTAINAIEQMMEPEPLLNPNVLGSLSLIRALLEKQAERSLNHAALSNKDAANQLSCAFDSLRTGLADYERFRDRIARGYVSNSPGFISSRGAAQQSFERGLTHLRGAKQVFTGGPPTSAP
jgi:hypothetical protein